ncbi:PREDICTED: uncharacterized protein LOC107334120 [Acropora digitifera]|uniref:uncharacterized protein LOC107334120 n=1 Tax=Acropora digitifera TaxID=70779 RepID=UPI00077ADBAA|nr:PREDICTED: uncharacterized protein LOC107334120 [Acropora digitifera]
MPPRQRGFWNKVLENAENQLLQGSAMNWPLNNLINPRRPNTTGAEASEQIPDDIAQLREKEAAPLEKIYTGPYRNPARRAQNVQENADVNLLKEGDFVAVELENYYRTPVIGKVFEVNEDGFVICYWKGSYNKEWTPHTLPARRGDKESRFLTQQLPKKKQFEADCQEQPTTKTTNEASQTVKNGNTNFVEITYKCQVISDECDLTNPRFKEECQNFLSLIKINYVEERTRAQSSNPEWFKYRTGRITASKFGEINNRRSATAPDRLVRDLIQYKKRTTTPFQCADGLRLEPVIKDKSVEYLLNHGHLGLCVEEKGVGIDQDNAFLQASVDGEVHDPSNIGSPVGNLEMKCKLFLEKGDPENNTRLLVTLATKSKNFCLEVIDSGLRLKRKHPYYSQVQGWMAIRRMQWCDFVVYTYTSAAEDIHVERIYFDPTFWVALKAKLVDFYLFAMIPELLTTRVKRGIPLYPNIFT